MSIQYITDTTTTISKDADTWDFSAVTKPFILDLINKKYTFNGTDIKFESLPSFIQLNGVSDQVSIPDNFGSKILSAGGDLEIRIISTAPEIISGGLNTRTLISYLNATYSSSFMDYSNNTITIDNNISQINGPALIQVSSSSTKNIAILDYKNVEYSLAPNSFNSINQLFPRALIAVVSGHTHLDNMTYLRFKSQFSNPTIGVLTDARYQIQNGIINDTFNGNTEISGSNTNDLFVSGINSKRMGFFSSKGSDTYISISGLDLLSFWDDFQGSSSTSYRTITVDLSKNYAMDGYGDRDQIYGFHYLEGSAYNPMNVVGGGGNNLFWLYGNKDIVDGGNSNGLKTLGFPINDLIFDLKDGIVRDSKNTVIANFKNINSVITLGIVNVTCNDVGNNVTVLMGQGGSIKGGQGNDNLFLTQNLLGPNYELSFDGGGGINSVYIYSPYSESIVNRTNSSTKITIGGLNNQYSNFLNGNYSSIKTQFNQLIAKGTLNLTNIQYINFIDGIYSNATGIFESSKVNFTAADSIVSNFYTLNLGAGSLGYPKGEFFPSYLDGQDISVDQITPKTITVGNGNDNIVSRFNNLIVAGDGNNYVMVLGDGCNISLGNGQNIVAIANPLTQKSVISAGNGFNVLEFNSPTVYKQSLPNISLKNISATYVPTLGYSFSVKNGSEIDFPALINFTNISNSLTAKYFYYGSVSTGVTNSALIIDKFNNFYSLVPLSNDNFINISPSTQYEFNRTLPLTSNTLNIDQIALNTMYLGSDKNFSININENLSKVSITNIADKVNLISFKNSNFYTADIYRFQFKDTNIAFDLNGSAGLVAKVLGSVFGKSSISNKSYVGIGLGLLDAGWTYDNLAALALDAAGLKSNDQIVSMLWTNVIGTKPTSADKQPFISLLENGMTAGALAHLAADTPSNTVNINLIGLAQTGIEYIPVN